MICSRIFGGEEQVTRTKLKATIPARRVSALLLYGWMGLAHYTEDLVD